MFDLLLILFAAGVMLAALDFIVIKLIVTLFDKYFGDLYDEN